MKKHEDRLGNLTKVTQVESDRTGIWTQGIWLQSLCA